MKTIGKILKEARLSVGLSQRDLARSIGYTTGQFISNWERGHSNPPVGKLKEIAKHLQIPASTLLDCLIESKTQQYKDTLGA